MDEETRDPGVIIVESEIAPGWKCTKPYVSLDGEMNDPGVIFGASHFVGDTCLSTGASAREVSAICRGCLDLSVAHSLSAGASARKLPAVCRGAFGSFCHDACTDARVFSLKLCTCKDSLSPSFPVVFGKDMRRIACTLHIVMFCLDLFVSY